MADITLYTTVSDTKSLVTNPKREIVKVEGEPSYDKPTAGGTPDRKAIVTETEPATSQARDKDDIVFETFYHRSGKEFQCNYQSGMRFYFDDWGSKEWQPFPKRWYNEGLLVTNTNLKNDQDTDQKGKRSQAAGDSVDGQSRSSGNACSQGKGVGSDDREGFVMHPSRGRIPTYIFYKKHNVHMYFDKDKGSWVRMPISWELHHQVVKALVDQVEEAVPSWGDRRDILSLLRACNYDPDACIAIYRNLQDDEWMKAPKTLNEGRVVVKKDVKIQESKARAREMLEEHTSKTSEIEAKSKQTEAKISAIMEESKGCVDGKGAKLKESRGSIRVFCRVRKDDRADFCLKFLSDHDIIAVHPQMGLKMFNFDRVFDPSSTQEQVFEDTKPVIISCADGYNVSLLAYGQTGSGKTFTMMGPESKPGINIRAMQTLLKVCAERKETKIYTFTVSMIEVYNETLVDLLSDNSQPLDPETAGNKVSIPDLTEHPIKNIGDVKKVMAKGDKNRSVASTKMNYTSSRSHLVLRFAVEGRDKVTNKVSRGTLTLCDLAGSERISKTEAEDQRLVEAAAINKSLSALGQVFAALRCSQLHIPYHNSKLTQILEPALGEDAKVCLFVNISPDAFNFIETVSTLTFGSNARQVQLETPCNMYPPSVQ